jgi:hypothetical protein
LTEQKAQLKSFAKLLIEAGWSIDDIATKINMTSEEVQLLLS